MTYGYEHDYIDLKDALKDYLKENGITLQDLLSVMDEEKEGIMEALSKRVALTDEDRHELERSLQSNQLNTLLFVIQAFYIINLGGLYKGRIIYPVREDVMRGGKVTTEGLRKIARALGIHLDLP
jgi:DNA-binding transcriptional MerR regulator